VDEAARNHLQLAIVRLRHEASLAFAVQAKHGQQEEDRIKGLLARAAEDEALARRDAGERLPIDTLKRRLSLRPLDESALLACVALDMDPLFAVVVTMLNGEEPRHGLSARLLAVILRLEGESSLALQLAENHTLVDSGLLESTSGPDVPDSLRAWRVRSRVCSYLLGHDEIEPLLRRAGEVVRPPDDLDLAHAQPALELLERVLDSKEPLIVCVEGPDGAGRRTLVAAAARRSSKEVVAVDAGRLGTERPRLLAELRALRRECWLRGAVPLVARLDAFARREGRPGERFLDIAEALESPGALPGPAVITMAAGLELPEFHRRVIRVRLDPPAGAARVRIWESALGPDRDRLAGEPLATAVQHYQLTPGSIRRAAANARLFAREEPIAAEHLQRGVAAEIEERFGGLATRVPVTQEWSDLVLPGETLDEVRAFEARARHAQLVYDGWGFRKKLGRGLGLAALFSGPPGTGKTMVAGLIARSLGLELYAVDLSQVVSKWVGETEKQLGRIFDAASMGQALLLFDEADALFARRTEVRSSNDRYANLEVNYLLQRIEQFGGVAILTTNLESSVDPAFKRRLAAEVRFYPPDRAERERLWRALLPERAPVEGGIDYEALADSFKEMCGGHIRNAVLRAAFLAAHEETPITHDHLARAARAEYRAMGKVL